MKIDNNLYNFISEIKQQIKKAQYEALKKVNKELLDLYWNIGKSIVLKQEQFGWGKEVVKTLSNELQKEFVGMRGFSYRNLWNMRQYHLEYKDNQKLQTLSAEIGWSYRVLDNHITNRSYEKYLLNQNNFDKVLDDKTYVNQAKLSVKDEYNFSFLELNREHSEYELEIGLINKIREFLTQMGSDFTFVANQYKLEVGEEEFFIDLLLYHRRLRSLIAIELKVGRFKPEYTGKMNFYLSVLNDKIKLPNENDSIGIIICKEKNRTIVEYALKDTSKPMAVSTYTTTDKLPQSYDGLLPDKKEIEQKLISFLENLDEK